MGTYTFVTDLNNLERNLGDAFKTLISTTPGILQLIGTSSDGRMGLNSKFEWLEKTFGYETAVLNNGGTVGSADTTFTVANSADIKIGHVLRFKDDVTGETMRVTNVNYSTHLVTVTRSLNGISPATTIADASTIRLLNKPIFEGSRAELESTSQATTEYNYSQRFRKDVGFTEEVAKVAMQYGYPSAQAYINEQVSEKMEEIRQELNASVLNGVRFAGNSSFASTFGGIYWWLKQADTNKANLSAAALTAEALNARLAELYERDTNGGKNLILYMDKTQARRIATFNTSVANQLVLVERRDDVAAGVLPVMYYESDLKSIAKAKIVIDKDALPGHIAILNLDHISLQYIGDHVLDQKDETPPDAVRGAKQIQLFSHSVLKFKYHTRSHGLIYNASPTL